MKICRPVPIARKSGGSGGNPQEMFFDPEHSVGIVDNSKPNAGHLLQRMASHLLADRGLSSSAITVERKLTAAQALEDEAFTRMQDQRLGLVLVGSGD